MNRNIESIKAKDLEINDINLKTLGSIRSLNKDISEKNYSIYPHFISGLIRLEQLYFNLTYQTKSSLELSKIVIEQSDEIDNLSDKTEMTPGVIYTSTLTDEEYILRQEQSSSIKKLQCHIESAYQFIDIIGDHIAIILSYFTLGTFEIKTLDHLQKLKNYQAFFAERNISGFDSLVEIANKIDSTYRNQFIVHTTKINHELHAVASDDPYLCISIFGGVKNEQDGKILKNPSPGIYSLFEITSEFIIEFASLILDNTDKLIKNITKT